MTHRTEEVTAWRIGRGDPGLTLLGRQPAAGASSTADLRFTPDGRFLYGTNRGHDSIAAYAVGDTGRLALIVIVS